LLLNKQRLNSRNRCQAASIIIEDLNLQKKFHTVKATGISARTIRNIELEINPPCLENALRLAAYLDVPVESLFKLDDTYQSQSI